MYHFFIKLTFSFITGGFLKVNVGWMNGMDGWMCGWISRWMDKWMDG
jgi:hypothetical protein